MYSWLRSYCYIIYLMFISSSSFALEITSKEISMGGFAFPVVCSHPSDLNYCVAISESEAEKKACSLWQVKLDTTYGYAFQGIITSGSTKFCHWKGKNPSNGTNSETTQQLSYKNGLCPLGGAPPPDQIAFSRQGRWFPQELEGNRCYRSCEYSNGQSFDYKQYVFTNGVMTNFTENMTSRLRSNQKFCNPVAEPKRNDEGEITYDASCEDSFLKVFCNFVEWYRSDAEMPDTPEVQQKSLDLSLLKVDHIQIDDNADNLCFAPTEFNFFIPWSRDEMTQEVKYTEMCSKLNSLGNLWRALFLIAAAFIIFGGRN